MFFYSLYSVSIIFFFMLFIFHHSYFEYYNIRCRYLQFFIIYGKT